MGQALASITSTTIFNNKYLLKITNKKPLPIEAAFLIYVRSLLCYQKKTIIY
ncbi:MAG: hypothetical protein ACJAXY_000055 [Nonlabens sp.]|jgi:hypothetical protein